VAAATERKEGHVGYRDIHVWEVETGEQLSSFSTPRPPFPRAWGGLALSPRGEWVAFEAYGARYAADGTLAAVEWTEARVFEVASRRSVATLKGAALWLVNLSFSPDGLRLAGCSRAFEGSASGAVWVWDTATWKPLYPDPIPGSYEQAAFSQDGSRLAAANRDHVKVWDVASGHEVLVLRGTTPRDFDRPFPPRVAWSADGLRLAASHDDGTISVWDATGRDTPEARAALRRAADARSFAWHLDEFRLAHRQHAPDAESWHLRRLLKAEPSTPALRFERAVLVAEAGRWREAIADGLRASGELLLDE
jgi:WD40 repeat protein